MNRFFFRCPTCFLKFTADVEGFQRPQVRECPVCTTRHFKCLGSTKGVLRMDVPCNDKCVFAEGPDCSCSCGGKNHGSKLLVPVLSGVVDFSGKGPSFLVANIKAKYDRWNADLAAMELGRPDHVKAAFAAGRSASDDQRRLVRTWGDWWSALRYGNETWAAREKKLAAFKAAFPGVLGPAPSASVETCVAGFALGVAVHSAILGASSFGQLDLFKM